MNVQIINKVSYFYIFNMNWESIFYVHAGGEGVAQIQELIASLNDSTCINE